MQAKFTDKASSFRVLLAVFPEKHEKNRTSNFIEKTEKGRQNGGGKIGENNTPQPVVQPDRRILCGLRAGSVGGWLTLRYAKEVRVSMRSRALFSILITVFMLVFVSSCGSGDGNNSDGGNSSNSTIGIIETKFGTIKIAFFQKEAPNHVDNFIKLAKSNFYNGTTFHRVIPDFLIQGGDPNTKDNDRSNDGLGGPGYTINDEINSIQHVRGIVSMAKSSPNTAGSQFFIVIDNASHLDGNQTVFGKVTEGMDVVDRIATVARDSRDNPIERVELITVSIQE